VTAPGKSYIEASACPKPGTITAAKTMNQTTRPMNEFVTNATIHGAVVTLITIVEQIMMGMKSAETEDVNFAIVMSSCVRSVDWSCKNKDVPSLYCATHLALTVSPDLCYPQAGSTKV
jgi:hypothetical protein